VHIPLPLFKGYLRMLPRVRARRELAAYRAAAAVHMKPGDRRSYVRELRRDADGGRKRARKATAADLAGIGITVEEVTT
jgi:hypothetical protein